MGGACWRQLVVYLARFRPILMRAHLAFTLCRRFTRPSACSNRFTKCRKEQTDFEESCPVS